MKTDNGKRRNFATWALALAMLAFPAAAFAADAGATDLDSQIQALHRDVDQKKKDLEALSHQGEQFRSLIQKKRVESDTLEDQIGLVDSRLAKTELAIAIAEEEIKKTGLEIQALEAKIKDHEERMSQQRLLLGSLARKLYRMKFGRSTLELLVAHDSFSAFFDSLHEVIALETSVHKTLDQVRTLHGQLENDKRSRTAKQDDLADRKRKLEVAKSELEDEREFKQSLLAQTQESELEYRYRLAELKREQNDADTEITYLERVLRQKLDLADRLKFDGGELAWPVVPSRGLATRFHDQDYPFRYVFEHPGIDIRAYQGTAIRAAAAGVVARAKNAGMGYSYVMLIHDRNVSTVYGHLSRITVKEDTFVERGEVIGYSGGMPGTPGAGNLTTGPHLHFETRVGGIPVNPLRFLASL